MIEKNEMGICPECGSDDTRLQDYEIDIDCLWTKHRCKECGEIWSEYAKLTYDGCHWNGQTYDKEGKEVDE